MAAYLVQIDGYDPVASSAVTLRAASDDDDRVCHLNDEVWWPAIAQLPKLPMDNFDSDAGSQLKAPSSSLRLMTEVWPLFGRYALADARIRIWSGTPGSSWSAWTLRCDGRVSGQPRLSAGAATVNFAVDDRWLDAPLLTTYSGTGGAEGPEALKGTAKPLILGAPRYVTGVLIDPINSVFQLSAYGPIQGVEDALDGLSRFGPSAGDYPSYEALIAATILPGNWATSLAVGMARQGAPPFEQITYMARGDVAGSIGWVRLPGDMIRRVALLSGGAGRIDDASLNALNLSCPWNLSIAIAAQTTARQVIQRLAASINAVAGVSWLGKLYVAPIGIAAPQIELRTDGSALPPIESVERVETEAPWWRLATQAERTWTVHEQSAVQYTQPADPGATVGAPPGTPLGTEPVEDVLAAIDAEFADARTDIDSLFSTFGSTASAAASADAAALAQSNAAAARDQAQAARDAAQGAESGALAAADASATSATDASGSATSSAGSATIATNKAAEAGNSATSASGAANVASVKAEEAASSASAASTSASSATGSADAAATSASAAQQSKVSADLAAQSMMPSSFQNLDNWTWDYANGTGSLTEDGRYVSYDHPTFGRILQVNNNPTFSPPIATRGRIALVRDRVLRLTVKWLLVGDQNGSPVNAVLHAIGLKPDGNQDNDQFIWCQISAGGAGWGASVWATHTFEVHTNTLMDQGCTWTRPLFRLDSQGVFYVQSIEMRDATGEWNAGQSANAAASSASTAAIKATEAGQSASAAQQSATYANTSAGDAQWYSGQASTSAGQASTSASNAVGSEGRASTYATNASNSAGAAGGSATAASNSASTASTKAGEAGGSADAAATSATQAQSYRDGAYNNAQTAIQQAGIATDKAAAAQFSATAAASVARNSLNPNPSFTDYPNASGEPANWTPWSYESSTPVRVAGQMPNSYAVHEGANANASQGGLQSGTGALYPVEPNSWLVIEARVKLIAGSLRGSGVWINNATAPGGPYSGDTGGINFASDPDATGNTLGAGSAGRTYSFSRMVRTPPGDTFAPVLYRMTNWDGFGQRDAKTLEWQFCSVRAATAEEIRSGTVIPDLQAKATLQGGALAQVDGRTQAYLEQIADAGGNRALIRTVAGGAGSLIDLQAKAIRLGDENLPAMAVYGGNVQVYGKLQAESVETNMLILKGVNTSRLADNAVSIIAVVARSTFITTNTFTTQNILSITKAKELADSTLKLSACLLLSTGDDLNSDFVVESTSGTTTSGIIGYDQWGPIYGDVFVPNYSRTVHVLLGGVNFGIDLPINFTFFITGWPAGTETWVLKHRNLGGNSVGSATLDAGSSFQYEEIKK